jgi:hypothetical protein
MTTKLRAVALAFVAVIAMSAVTASAAQATGTFEAEEYPALLTSEQTESFSFESELGTIVCKTSTFAGELTGSSSQLALTPTFGSCTLGGTAVTYENEGCQLVSHNAEETAEGTFESQADIACPAGKGVKFHLAFGCLLTVNAQINLSDLEINITLGIPPRIEIVSQIAGLQAKLENTPGKTCLFGTKNLKINVGGKSKIGAKNKANNPIGLTLK